MAAPAHHIRIFSQNVCVLPAGAHEAYLQKGGLCVLVFVTLVLPTTAWWCLPHPWRPAALAIAAALYGSGAIVAIGGYAALITLGVPLRLLKGFCDYKSERLQQLAEVLAQRPAKWQAEQPGCPGRRGWIARTHNAYAHTRPRPRFLRAGHCETSFCSRSSMAAGTRIATVSASSPSCEPTATCTLCYQLPRGDSLPAGRTAVWRCFRRTRSVM